MNFETIKQINDCLNQEEGIAIHYWIEEYQSNVSYLPSKKTIHVWLKLGSASPIKFYPIDVIEDEFYLPLLSNVPREVVITCARIFYLDGELEKMEKVMAYFGLSYHEIM